MGSYLIKDMEILEKTQKFGLRVCLKDWSSDYTDLLSVAKIPTLSSRCSQARLTHMFKIINQLSDFPDLPIVSWTFHYHSRFDNSMAIKPFHCRSTQFLHSFPRTTSQWNSLSLRMVSQTSIPAFKHSISDCI